MFSARVSRVGSCYCLSRSEARVKQLTGPGILWDSKEKLLHWVDIDTAEVHT
jgi:sugar lactone lactonase YvrE